MGLHKRLGRAGRDSDGWVPYSELAFEFLAMI